MDFIDHQNDIALFAYFFNQAFHPALELSSELRSRHQRGQVKQQHLFVLKLIWDLSIRDTLSKAFSNRGFSDAWFSDEAGIVFLPSVQNLDNALEFHFSADHAVQFALCGTCSQIDAVIVQKFPSAAFSTWLTRTA